MPKILDPDAHFAVERDGLPRLADYDDGTQQMLFRDGGVVRSVPLADWPAEEQAQAQRDAARAKRGALRASLQAAAAAHAGKRGDTLTLPELRDVVLILLEAAGLLDEDGKIKA